MLVGGTAGAQLLAVLAAPLLTRLYTPEDFGLLAVYASLLGLIAVIASLRYELAIPLPEDDSEAANVAALSLILVGINTVLVGILTVLLRQPISNALGVPQLGPYLWMLPLGVLAGGVYNVFNYWAVRTKCFSTIAGTRIVQSLSMLGIQLAAFELGGVALVFGQFVGQGAGTIKLALNAFATDLFKKVTLSGVKNAAKRYKQLPIFSTWEALANTAGTQLPPLLFSMVFGPASAGLYSLANRVLTLPMSLIGGAVGQVFFSNAAEAHRNGQLASLVVQLHSKLAHIGLPPALILMLLGPDIFSYAFGEGWREAGEFARWMAPWLYLVFVTSPLSTLFAVVEKLKQNFVFQVLFFGARLLAIGSGIWIGNLSITVIIFSATSAVFYLGFLFWIGRLSGNTIISMIKPSIYALLLTLPCIFPGFIGMTLSNSQSLALIASLPVSIIMIGMYYFKILK